MQETEHGRRSQDGIQYNSQAQDMIRPIGTICSQDRDKASRARARRTTWPVVPGAVFFDWLIKQDIKKSHPGAESKFFDRLNK